MIAIDVMHIYFTKSRLSKRRIHDKHKMLLVTVVHTVCQNGNNQLHNFFSLTCNAKSQATTLFAKEIKK